MNLDFFETLSFAANYVYVRWSAKSVDFGTLPKVKDAPPAPPLLHGCSHPVQLQICIEAAVESIIETIAYESNQAFRKPPFLISRCSRGGKSTAELGIELELRKRGASTIYVSFNGTSGFKRIRGESECAALFRMIVSRIDPHHDPGAIKSR